jgi:hypothetical protein
MKPLNIARITNIQVLEIIWAKKGQKMQFYTRVALVLLFRHDLEF